MKKISFEGTAQEIGTEMFLEIVMPVVRQVSNKAPPEALAELYAGLLAATMGSLAADFGKPAAKNMLLALCEQFDEVVLEVGGLQ